VALWRHEEILERVKAIGTDIAHSWLVGQDCFAVDYLDRLRAALALIVSTVMFTVLAMVYW
jgi:hypothetical protein